MISIKGLKRALVLAALYNASRPQGMGFMHYNPSPMTEQEAEELLKKQTDFDYLKGRVMKIRLNNDEQFEERLYDRDNGQGAAERVIASLRASGSSNNPQIAVTHERGVVEAADDAKFLMKEKSKTEPGKITLGLADMEPHLAPKVDEAIQKQTSKQN